MECSLCKCGCREKVKPGNKYINGHIHKDKRIRQMRSERIQGDKNPSKRLEVREKMSLAKKGKYLRENSPSWKGGFYINKKGIKVISTSDRGEIAESRLIAEKALGRYLTSNEVVHHIDENKTNNSNNNLLVCTKSYHLFLHRRMSPERYKRPKGYKQSEETKKKRAEKHKKPIMVNGIKYPSVKMAIEKSNLCFVTIKKRINEKIEGYTYLKREVVL